MKVWEQSEQSGLRLQFPPAEVPGVRLGEGGCLVGIAGWGSACQVQGHERREWRRGPRKEESQEEDPVHGRALRVLRSRRGQSTGNSPNVTSPGWSEPGAMVPLWGKSGHRGGAWGANYFVPRSPV